MRRGFGFLGLIATVIVLVIVGAIAYNIGWSDGVNTHLPAGTAAPAPAPYYYGFGFHPFFAGFGILWFLFILFGIFFLFRLAFWGFAGRRMWGYGRGWGYGGHGGDGPRSFEERAQEWHRRQHEPQSSQTPQSPPGSTPPPPPPSDTRSV
jgi:hypothetical protein